MHSLDSLPERAQQRSSKLFGPDQFLASHPFVYSARNSHIAGTKWHRSFSKRMLPFYLVCCTISNMFAAFRNVPFFTTISFSNTSCSTNFQSSGLDKRALRSSTLSNFVFLLLVLQTFPSQLSNDDTYNYLT